MGRDLQPRLKIKIRPMEQTTVKYGTKKLKLKQMSLGLRRDSAKLLIQLKDLVKDGGNNPETALIDFIHDETNLTNLFDVFIDETDRKKIKMDFIDNENYINIVNLASEIISSFFGVSRSKQPT